MRDFQQHFVLSVAIRVYPWLIAVFRINETLQQVRITAKSVHATMAVIYSKRVGGAEWIDGAGKSKGRGKTDSMFDNVVTSTPQKHQTNS